LLGSSDAVCIFIIKDEYEHDWYPEVRRIGMWMGDVPPDKQDRGIVLPIKANTPVRFVQAPNEKDLSKVKERIKSRFVYNIQWMKLHRNLYLPRSVQQEIFRNIDDIFNLIETCASAVKNYADFTIRLWIELLRRTNPDLSDNIFFVSFLDSVNHVFREELNLLFRVIPEHFWYYCQNLHRGKNLVCSICGEQSSFICPDIVAFELVTSLLRPKSRIVGGFREYMPIIDKLTTDFYGFAPPPRVIVSGPYPVFYGIPEIWGDTRTSIVRALFEVDAQEIGVELLKRRPVIRSKFLDKICTQK
jgi:hypothetical protein